MPRKYPSGLLQTMLIGAGSVLVQVASAGCALPPAPSKVPQAASATDTEMRDAMQTLKRYEADVNGYVKCLAFEVKQGRLSAEDGARQHNAAVDRLQKAAALFNEQMRIFLGH